MAGFSPRYYLFIKMRKFYCCDKGFRETDRPEGVCWVDVVTPHTGDVEYLTKVEQVPEMFLEYLQDKDERARVERDGDWMMTIVRIPIRAHGAMPYVTVPLGVISHGLNRVITVCYHQNHLIDDFAEHTRRKCVLFDNVANFTLRILYSASYWYLAFLRSLTEDVIGTGKISAERRPDDANEDSEVARILQHLHQGELNGARTGEENLHRHPRR